MGVVVVEMEVRPTIGILVPSLSLRLGIGVWMFAIVANGLENGDCGLRNLGGCARRKETL